jgi:hypothetical protein
MSAILQSYHATDDGTRGLHAFTTSEAFEALALANALTLRAAVGELLAWSGAISESVAQSHGESRTTDAIRNTLAKLEVIYDQAGGNRHG